MIGFRQTIGIAAATLSSLVLSSPGHAQAASSDEQLIDDALDKVRDTSRNRLLAEIASAGVEQYATGAIQRFAPSVLRFVAGGPIGVFLAFMAPKRAGIGSDVVPFGPEHANNLSQCEQASISFSYRRFSESVTTIEDQTLENPEMTRDRKRQMYDFWIDSRHQINVQKCLLWFRSGRTSPFYPS